jgi:AcrR family transcriptional regulator
VLHGERPRNRKVRLADAAADLFRRHGYHAVSVNDIAAAAGVTGPAVYRHFRGKQDLLAHVLLTALDAFSLVTEEALAPQEDGPAEALDRLLAAVAALAVERRESTALWRWQGSHLDQADQVKIRRRGAEIMEQWVLALRDARLELAPDEAELLCWAALSVFGSVAVHHVNLPRRRFERLLAVLAGAVLAAPAVPPGPVAAPSPRAGGLAWQPVSRREELLSAATRLFRERGFHAVSMEDIGAAAGIAGPSIYRHFTSKADLLVAAGFRMADRLAADARRAIDDAATPDEALTNLARSYVDTVLRSDDLLAVFASEVANVPDRDRKELVRVQRSYVAEWVRLLRETVTGLPEPEARIVAHAALTIVNDLARTPRIVARPGIVGELAGLATIVLNAPKDR